MSRNFVQRSISGFMLVTIILTLIYIGGPLFDLLCGILLTALILEWLKLWWVQARKNSALSAKDLLIIVLGLVYITAGIYKYWTLKEFPTQQIITFVIVWSTDIGAYLTGKRYGKHPFAPKISPNKTWEGFWGGVVFCILVCSIIMHTKITNLTPYHNAASYIYNFFGTITLFSLTVFSVRYMFYSVAAHLGDLLESWVKRYLNIKESGNIIPGHGGVLDRFDSFLGVCTAYYVKDALHYYGIFF